MSATKSSTCPALLYRCGPYEANHARSELRKFGIRIRLERKLWQLLITLLDHAGEVVTRSDLQRFLWGEDVFVDFDTGLNVAVKKLRGATIVAVVFMFLVPLFPHYRWEQEARGRSTAAASSGCTN